MGDIAEGLLSGEFDEETGEYLGEAVGYPRSAQRDKREAKEKNAHPVSGVKGYLKQFMLGKYMHAFCIDAMRELHDSKLDHRTGWKNLAVLVQDNWKGFVKYTQKFVKSGETIDKVY